jgi:hypothetical protein
MCLELLLAEERRTGLWQAIGHGGTIAWVVRGPSG